MPDDSYEIYAVRYAHYAPRRARENFLVPGALDADAHEGAMPFDYFVWAVVGNGRTIVVDFSSPNIAKLFTIGHLRSTMIGHASTLPRYCSASSRVAKLDWSPFLVSRTT